MFIWYLQETGYYKFRPRYKHDSSRFRLAAATYRLSSVELFNTLDQRVFIYE